MNFQPLELLNRMEWLKEKIVLQKIAMMIYMQNIPMQFWVEFINTICYTANMIFLTPGTKKTSHELWTGRTPNLKYFKTFGNECYILRDYNFD